MFKIRQKYRPTMHQHRIDGKWTTFQQPTFQNEWFEGMIIKLILRTRVWLCCNGKSERTYLFFSFREHRSFPRSWHSHSWVDFRSTGTHGRSFLTLAGHPGTFKANSWLADPANLVRNWPSERKTNCQTMALWCTGWAPVVISWFIGHLSRVVSSCICHS